MQGGRDHNTILSLLVKSFIFVLYVLVFCLHACMYTTVVQGLERSEGGIRALELKLQVVMSQYIGLGTEAGSPTRASKALRH